MKAIDDKLINSIEELEAFIKEKYFSKEKDFIIGQLNEQDLIAYLDKNCIAYKRMDFKKWKILSIRPARSKYLIRLVVLIVFLALLAWTLIKPIAFLWKQLENLSANFSFLGNLLAELLAVGISSVIVSLFWRKIKFLYHLYMD